MDWKHENDELPEELADSLRSLGEVKAPPELWHRVVLATEGLATAPEALRTRVAPAVRDAAYPDAPVLPFRRRLASAAALLFVAGVGMLSVGLGDSGPVEFVGPRELVRSHLRNTLEAEALVERDAPRSSLSPASRLFAGNPIDAEPAG